MAQFVQYAKRNSGIGFPGALELIMQCKSNGLKVAVASSADRIKVDANLAAAGLPLSMFDAIVSADAFENLKPAPDIFLAATKILNVPPSECIVIEDALAGVQAAKVAEMRCIAVTTTLSEETLKQAGPSLIRKEIRNVSLQDILDGGVILERSKIAFDVPEMEAEYVDGVMRLYATVVLPKNMAGATANQVWQVGSSVTNGIPNVHGFGHIVLRRVGSLIVCL